MVYHCANCNKYWNHEIKTCIFCGNETHELKESEYAVVSYTKVHIPSKGNESVPYFVYLLQGKNGQRIIQKSDHQYQIGEVINLDKMFPAKFPVGVIGSGLMGVQIAEYLLRAGYPVTLKTRSEENIPNIILEIRRRLSKNIPESEVVECLRNLIVTTNHAEFSEVELIIEAVKEDFEAKKEVFLALSDVCAIGTIFATNSSSLSVDALAEVTNRPDKFIGLHFFNPVNRMNLVEVVVGKKTSETTKEFALKFVQDLKKKPIVVRNSPGFIVNRLLLPQINEAIRLLDARIASKEDIDSAMKLGLNHPMGPFELADFIGLDTCLSILEVLYDSLGDEHLKPAPLLHEMVRQGKLGLKSGEGFYRYK